MQRCDRLYCAIAWLLHTGDAPHPTTIQTRARVMNRAAHQERWVVGGPRGPPHLRAVTHRFINLRDRDPPSASPLLTGPHTLTEVDWQGLGPSCGKT